MLKTCAKSCGVCDTGGCMNKNQTQCLLWGEHECTVNPAHMMKACPDLCGVCTLGCTDKQDLCKEWAEQGECETNKKMMLATCPKSCGICKELNSAPVTVHEEL